MAELPGVGLCAAKVHKDPRVLESESKVLQRVSGAPHVLRFLGRSHSPPALLMPVCVPWEEVLTEVTYADAVAAVSSALDTLQRVGICHTDIKPDSIMFETERRRFVLTDFSNACSSGSMVLFGEHQFVMPELRGRVAVATEADRYSASKVIEVWAGWLRQRRVYSASSNAGGSGGSMARSGGPARGSAPPLAAAS